MNHPDTSKREKRFSTDDTEETPRTKPSSRTRSPREIAERAVALATARYAAAEHELRRARFEQALRRATTET